jgi:hypothetical protein
MAPVELCALRYPNLPIGLQQVLSALLLIAFARKKNDRAGFDTKIRAEPASGSAFRRSRAAPVEPAISPGRPYKRYP